MSTVSVTIAPHSAKPKGLTSAERMIAPADISGLAYVRADARTRRAMLADARVTWRAFRVSQGMADRAPNILTPPDAQPKLRKSIAPTYGLTLVPAMRSGRNLCPAATFCAEVCLVDTGKGVLSSVAHARLVRALFAMEHASAFGILLASEILRAIAKHGRRRMRVRLNVLSDIRWEIVMPNTLRALIRAGARFYDYSKWAPKLRAHSTGLVHLTYSASERMTDSDIHALVSAGHNVAVVFRAPKRAVHSAIAAGATWQGLPMVDGLATDDRTTDAQGVIVALAALGSARHDTSGFVRTFAITLP